MVLICPTGPLHHQTISSTLVLSSAVPSAFGFKRIKMAVVWMQSPSAIHSGLKLPPSAHFSRTAIGMVRICRVVWILAKCMSPKWRLSCTLQDWCQYQRWALFGHEGILECPVGHLKKKIEVSTVHTRQGMQGLNVSKDGHEVSWVYTYLVCVNLGVWCVLCAGFLWTWVVYPSRARWRMKTGLTFIQIYNACARVSGWECHWLDDSSRRGRASGGNGMTSSLGQWGEGILWKNPWEGIKGGTE